MKYTPNRIAKMHQKIDQTPTPLRRDSDVDYYHGWFFVTLNTRDEVPVLSSCEGNAETPDGQPGAPKCVYSDVGNGVWKSWQKMAEVCNTVEVDLCEVMPEHFHGLLHRLPNNKRHLGSLISGFMSGCTHAYWDVLGIEWRKNRDEKVWTKQVKGKLAYASLTPDRDRDHSYSLIGPSLFVHGYNDMEPITEQEVEVKRAYIRDQARKRLVQGDRHECFRKYRHQHSRNWTVERCTQVIAVDKCFRNDAVRCEKAVTSVLAKLNQDTAGETTIGLDSIGNRALLFAEKKLPLVCHSAEAGQFEQQKQAVLEAARQGWTIVSAFISPKERDIKQQLMVEQLPFVEIMDNGFSEKYKGTGRAFYALAENRLCQITPWRYEYQKEGPKVSREMCLVMNELARVISGQSDDWWKTFSL